MTARRAATPPPAYHHGSLREAIVAAANEILEEEGAAAIGFRTAARRVPKGTGTVSHTAARAWFGSREELLAAVAMGWWERLRDCLEAVPSREAPSERLISLGVAYRTFAVEHSNGFRLMYDASMWEAILALDRVDSGHESRAFRERSVAERVVELRNACYLLFVDALSSGREQGTFSSEHPLDLQARMIASLSHGLAMEALDEKLKADEAPKLLRLAVSALQALPERKKRPSA